MIEVTRKESTRLGRLGSSPIRCTTTLLLYCWRFSSTDDVVALTAPPSPQVYRQLLDGVVIKASEEH